MGRGRASLEVGDLVTVGKAGKPLAQFYGITGVHVMKVIALVPATAYGRKAYQVAFGKKAIIVWPSQIRLLRRRKRRKEDDFE